jgi:hypothetical protein
MYQSLFEYLGKRAGPDLGKQVYAAAKRNKIKVSSKQIATGAYRGTILIYPVSFLDSYFIKATISSTSYFKSSPCDEIALSTHTPTTLSTHPLQKENPLKNLY